MSSRFEFLSSCSFAAPLKCFSFCGAQVFRLLSFRKSPIFVYCKLIYMLLAFLSFSKSVTLSKTDAKLKVFGTLQQANIIVQVLLKKKQTETFENSRENTSSCILLLLRPYLCMNDRISFRMTGKYLNCVIMLQGILYAYQRFDKLSFLMKC